MSKRTSDHAAFYEAWFGKLCAIAVHRFHIPLEDAERIAHEVLLSSLLSDARGLIGPDVGSWLKGAMRLASQHYIDQRASGRKQR